MERPILFSTPMVQAILDGRKIMTRRIYKPEHVKNNVAQCPYGKPGDILWVRETWQKSECFDFGIKNQFVFRADGNNAEFADEHKIKWRPSIFMPREACRIKLLIKDIRVERLQDITEEDAKAEGVGNLFLDEIAYSNNPKYNTPMQGETLSREQFELLWDSINVKRGYGWDVNPWVWVVSFERIEAAHDH